MWQANSTGVPLPSTRDWEGGVGPGKPQGSLWKRQMEGSFLPPPHYEVRALKGLQGGKEGIHLVSTHHVSGAVLSTVRGQPCLSHQPAQWRTPGKALPHKGREVWPETAGCPATAL